MRQKGEKELMRAYEFRPDEIRSVGRMIIDLDAVIRLVDEGDRWRVVFADGWYDLKTKAAFDRLFAAWNAK